MGKKLSKRSDALIIVLVVLFVAVGAYFLVQHHFGKTPPLKPSASLSPQASLLVDVAVWYPSAPWSEPAPATQATAYGELSGESISATVSSQNAMLDHFEDTEYLGQHGFVEDTTLAADGPGSSTWGYRRQDDGQYEILLFSYETKPSNDDPNQPLQFNCPCEITVTAFASDPFNPTTPN